MISFKFSLTIFTVLTYRRKDYRKKEEERKEIFIAMR